MKTIDVRKSVTAANDRLAADLRREFARRGVTVLNLIASPGAGKTTLLERTIAELGSAYAIRVVEGDPFTGLDSERIVQAGADSIQINTEGGCHLDARMVGDAVRRFDLARTDLIVIENVGNLLCPAAWDLGQDATVVVAALTDGADKPLKYPDAFVRAQLMLINKIDLAPHLPVAAANLEANARRINAALTVFPISCLTGAGMGDWYRWVNRRRSCPNACARCTSRPRGSSRPAARYPPPCVSSIHW